MKKTFLLSLSLSLSLLLGSCQKEDLKNDIEILEDSSVMSRGNDDADSWSQQRQIVLGNQMTNAYSVSTMRSAFKYYNDYLSNSPFKSKVVNATHKYIKFLPTTESHLQILDGLGNSNTSDALVLQDYPMDYEVIVEGDYYVWPANANDIYYPVYTVIPINYQLPSNLPYQVLEMLYEPTEAEYDVETVALVIADWQQDILADYGYNITIDGLPEFLDTIVAEQPLGGRKFTPRGWVEIQNTQNNTLDDPLMNAKISIGRSLWWRYTNTDATGYFTANKKYRGKVRIRSKWSNDMASIRKSWNEMLGIQVSDHLMTLTRNSNDRTKTIRVEDEQLWYKGTVHNGLTKYNTYAYNHGIDKLIGGAIVWVWQNGSGAASTPMLRRYPQLADMAQIAGLTQGAFWSTMVSNVITFVPPVLRPDNIYTGLELKTVDAIPSTALIEQTVYHESSHYSHARKAGASFWANLFASEINNSHFHGDPYYNGIKPTLNAAKRIAVAEGWATFMEFTMMEDAYGMAWSGGIWQTNPTVFIENYDVYDVPMQIEQRDNFGWFLTGLIWDIQDTNSDAFATHLDGNGIFLNNIIDNFSVNSGASLQPIFDRLNSNATTAKKLKDNLIAVYPNNSAQINQLFTSYGY